MMQAVCRFLFKVAWFCLCSGLFYCLRVRCVQLRLLRWSSLWNLDFGYLCTYSCLMFTAKYLINVFIFSVIHILFVLCLWWHVSGFIPVLVALDCVIRGLDLCRLALNHLFWLWFVWLMLLLRHPGVSHQFHKREFTTHLNLSIRRGALFPLLRFQLTGTDEPWTESFTPIDLDFARALERNPT